jgi:protein-disulfide isomerase-like protein with CxxC motif
MKQMIKRKDGSYSQRGLWDNIRAKKGSGKKPTKQMLQQEKKIKAKMENGGMTPANKAAMNLAKNMKGKVVGSDRMLKKGGTTSRLKQAYINKLNNYK